MELPKYEMETAKVTLKDGGDGGAGLTLDLGVAADNGRQWSWHIGRRVSVVSMVEATPVPINNASAITS